jgi:hypothetical protein
MTAAKTGRRGYGIEIDPAHHDVTIRGLHRVCGLNAVLEATGQRFAIRDGLRDDGLKTSAQFIEAVKWISRQSFPRRIAYVAPRILIFRECGQ